MTSGPDAGSPPASGAGPGAPAGSVGPYRLVERLGRGGMGEVWLAEDPSGAAGGAPRLVAIKRLADRLAGDTAFRSRFAREVAALRRVASPYVAPLLDADTEAPVPWHASAYVAGPTLADHVGRHGPLGDRPLRALGLALAEALAAIHAAGVVHRDLTPRNIVLGPDGPRVVDFGIAWYPGAVPVTQAGASVGTPSWMAPERLFAGGDAASPASDVWSWGAVMAYAAGGPGTTTDDPGLPGWLAPWARVATEFAADARPTAATLRAAMAADALGPTDPATDLVPGATLPATAPAGRPAAAHVPPAGGAHPEAATRPAAVPTRTTPDHGRRVGRGSGPERGRRAGRRAPRDRGRTARPRWTAPVSALVLLAVAGGVGAVVEPLAAVLVATGLVLASLVLRHRRGRYEDRRRRVPPTWSVTLAAPTVLGASLAATFGLVPGLVTLGVILVVFLVLAGDMIVG